MGRSTTSVVKFRKLAADPDLGQILVRLMMACNDFATANEMLGQWRNPATRKQKARADGAQRYFLRLQISHVCEAMDMVDEIERSTKLKAAVAATDPRTRRSFDRLKQYKKDKHYKIMKLIRNKVSSHYDPVWVKDTIVDLDKNHPDMVASISMGHEALDWHFEPAELVEDRLVVRKIFQVAASANVRIEADKILEKLHEIAAVFGDFAGYFVKHHSR
jgi:murein L,D-transpeptidase YcbB/YkuD